MMIRLDVIFKIGFRDLVIQMIYYMTFDFDDRKQDIQAAASLSNSFTLFYF